VRAALREIGYSSWATAEVRGGDQERLATVRELMENVLG
jgi:L-ribulose-5-phosphate 3-epimerase